MRILLLSPFCGPQASASEAPSLFPHASPRESHPEDDEVRRRAQDADDGRDVDPRVLQEPQVHEVVAEGAGVPEHAEDVHLEDEDEEADVGDGEEPGWPGEGWLLLSCVYEEGQMKLFFSEIKDKGL